MSNRKQSLLEWSLDQLIKQYRKDESELFYKVEEVISASRLENKDGIRPNLIKKTESENGWHLIFNLPPDITLDDFEKRRKSFQTFTNSIVEFKNNGPIIIMSVYRKKLKEIIPFHFDPRPYLKTMLAPLPIGYSPTGKLAVTDMASVHHMLISGVTGYGKTSGLLGMVTSLLIAGCEVSVIDKKAIDFPILSDYLEVAITENETETMLKKTVKEMEIRAEKLRDAKAQKIQQVKDMKYKVVIIDEAADIESNNSWEAIDKLVRKARAGGIGLIIATQKPSANTSKGFTDIRSNLAGRLCYYVNGDSTDSQIALGKGNSRAAELPAIAGRCIWKWKTEEMLQSMFLDTEEAIKILQEKNIPKREVKQDEQSPVLLPPG
ncbi:FtsK/SpoIIIE domain-containing protein [Desulfosporosinus sp. PR]|uniref:FtsK/SpoIIIE domain-containing protein n=1 Tax=Candidatus Desulfosporosinus nitrosoreducens TaxID=3401928 RepID=UPI0027F12A95|nr:FtsK/SpoIIIE domain-containing protein [Desulfosporosinus sp. PR]MDQ7094248.1 FtsK/SpoIIIE domain-containing protein [Desulfosporosinus sp. PR]